MTLLFIISDLLLFVLCFVGCHVVQSICYVLLSIMIYSNSNCFVTPILVGNRISSWLSFCQSAATAATYIFTDFPFARALPLLLHIFSLTFLLPERCPCCYIYFHWLSFFQSVATAATYIFADFPFSRALPLLLHIFSLLSPVQVPTIMTLEPCALNAEFQDLILSIMTFEPCALNAEFQDLILSIMTLEPCALNAEFQDLILKFNKISLLCGYH